MIYSHQQVRYHQYHELQKSITIPKTRSHSFIQASQCSSACKDTVPTLCLHDTAYAPVHTIYLQARSHHATNATSPVSNMSKPLILIRDCQLRLLIPKHCYAVPPCWVELFPYIAEVLQRPSEPMPRRRVCAGRAFTSGLRRVRRGSLLRSLHHPKSCDGRETAQLDGKPARG